jgi:ribosomal protein L37AE/L43A
MKEHIGENCGRCQSDSFYLNDEGVWKCTDCGSIKRKAHPHEIERWEKEYENFKKNISQIQEK